MVVRATREGMSAVVAFLGAFAIAIVSANMFIAWTAHRAQNFFEGQGYRTLMRLVGIAMLIFAGLFAWRGLSLLREVSGQ